MYTFSRKLYAVFIICFYFCLLFSKVNANDCKICPNRSHTLSDPKSAFYHRIFRRNVFVEKVIEQEKDQFYDNNFTDVNTNFDSSTEVTSSSFKIDSIVNMKLLEIMQMYNLSVDKIRDSISGMMSTSVPHTSPKEEHHHIMKLLNSTKKEDEPKNTERSLQITHIKETSTVNFDVRIDPSQTTGIVDFEIKRLGFEDDTTKLSTIYTSELLSTIANKTIVYLKPETESTEYNNSSKSTVSSTTFYNTTKNNIENFIATIQRNVMTTKNDSTISINQKSDTIVKTTQGITTNTMAISLDMRPRRKIKNITIRLNKIKGIWHNGMCPCDYLIRSNAHKITSFNLLIISTLIITY